MSEELILFYFWPTPNGQKIAIALEETGLPYKLRYIDINAGAQFGAEFLKISPNNKIPAIVDTEGPDGNPLSIFESGAILRYLALKTEQFYPANERKRADVDQWLFWQVGGLGPMAGQCLHFRDYAPEKVPYAIERYTKEVTRLFGVLDRRLSTRDHIAGDFSIADMACYPWIMRWSSIGQDIKNFPNIGRWLERVSARPAVQRAMALGRDPAERVDT